MYRPLTKRQRDNRARKLEAMRRGKDRARMERTARGCTPVLHGRQKFHVKQILGGGGLAGAYRATYQTDSDPCATTEPRKGRS